MKKLLFVIFMLCSASAWARQITAGELHEVLAIGKRYGVPESVIRQLMHEESRGDVDAQSDVTFEGYYSAGLFQIYTKPENYDYLLWKYWPSSEGEFDVYNPIHNASVALPYLRDLHTQYGSWYKALLFYNHGDIKTASERTKAYARRIINAK